MCRCTSRCRGRPLSANVAVFRWDRIPTAAHIFSEQHRVQAGPPIRSRLAKPLRKEREPCDFPQSSSVRPADPGRACGTARTTARPAGGTPCPTPPRMRRSSPLSGSKHALGSRYPADHLRLVPRRRQQLQQCRLPLLTTSTRTPGALDLGTAASRDTTTSAAAATCAHPRDRRRSLPNRPVQRSHRNVRSTRPDPLLRGHLHSRFSVSSRVSCQCAWIHASKNSDTTPLSGAAGTATVNARRGR